MTLRSKRDLDRTDGRSKRDRPASRRSWPISCTSRGLQEQWNCEETFALVVCYVALQSSSLDRAWDYLLGTGDARASASIFQPSRCAWLQARAKNSLSTCLESQAPHDFETRPVIGHNSAPTFPTLVRLRRLRATRGLELLVRLDSWIILRSTPYSAPVYLSIYLPIPAVVRNRSTSVAARAPSTCPSQPTGFLRCSAAPNALRRTMRSWDGTRRPWRRSEGARFDRGE